MTLYPCRFATPDAECPQTPTYSARECTSYAAWRGSEVLQRQWPKDWGNATNWRAAAHYAGFRVDTTPEVNCIMALAPNTNGAGPMGHVGWVVGVEAATVVVQEYDFLVRFGYDERDFPIHGAEFIHLPQPPEEDLTPQQAQQLQDIWDAIFGPVPIDGGEGTAIPNNIDIIRRKVSPYKQGYPPANPPVVPGAP